MHIRDHACYRTTTVATRIDKTDLICVFISDTGYTHVAKDCELKGQLSFLDMFPVEDVKYIAM